MRLILSLKSIIFILPFGMFTTLLGQSGIVTFSDTNFEHSIRKMVEQGRIWIPEYSSNYQFKESDLSNHTWLNFDDYELKLTNLVDLRWFPNLYFLHIWDASQISDFSPIWEFSDQLLRLSINGSRGANLSGVATMNALESLDLDDNQLTDLSILGNHPNLIQIYIVGNFLDLGDQSVLQKIENFSNQIYNKRNQLGWWWYSDDAVEYTPQYPLGFRDLSSETARVQQIINSTTNDAEANLLRGIYALLEIYQTNDAHGLKEFAVSAGVDPAVRNFVLSDLGILEDYEYELDRSFNFGELAQLFEQSIIPSLESADAYFSKVPSSSVIDLDSELTGTKGVVSVDYADVLVLRTITNFLAGLYALQSGYDWNVNAGHMEDLDNSDDMSVEEVRASNSNFGGIRSSAQLAKAKFFFQTAIDLYQMASPLLTDYNRWDVDNRLFVLSQMDLEEEAEFRDALLDIESALAGPYAFEEGGDRIDLSRLFSGQVDLSTILPQSKKDKFVSDQLDDPTMGGLLPDWTQRRVSDEIYEADLLWDERAMVFWRYESVIDDLNPSTTWNKQSVILRQLGDDSEEVLYSVNAKNLVAELGLDTTMNSGLWLQESKVCISPDGSQLIFGYALISSMMGVSATDSDRYLVRIIKYDLINRTSSSIREWIGSNLSDSMNSKYVNFCIDALHVDWNNEKIYFSEKILSSGGAFEQVDYVKLVTCGFDGQNLTAIKKFDRLDSGMSSLEPLISMISLAENDPSKIRVSLQYSDSMGFSKVHQIYTIDASGNQLVVPIENENRGGGAASSEPLDSFNTFSTSLDGVEIYFITYEQDIYSTSVIEPSISKMTNQGYDKQTVVELGSLSYRSDVWSYWSSDRRPEVVMMSGVTSGKIMLGVEYRDQWNQVAPPEILEVDLSTGDYEVLTTGMLESDFYGRFAYDDFSTVSLFYPDGFLPPQINTDSDGDGLPDDVEIAAGMNPNSSDKAVVDAVYNYFFSQEGGGVKSLQKAMPYTYNWYYQPGMGWMWTSASSFPYIFKSSTDGDSGGWMYFSEQTTSPIRMYDFERSRWISVGE
jgi:hypothetical protein